MRIALSGVLWKFSLVTVIALFVLAAACEESYARAGKGGSKGFSSYGSRGSRTYSAPAPTRQAGPQQNQAAQSVQNPQQPRPAFQQSASGGFMRALAGGLIGGVIGSLLFSALGHASFGSTGGMGIGLFDIILIGAVIYLIYRLMRSRREPTPAMAGAGSYAYSQPTYQPTPVPVDAPAPGNTASADFLKGINGIKTFDPGFDEEHFHSTAIDIFFRVQSAWSERDSTLLKGLLAPDILTRMETDIEGLRREGRINRIERLSVRDFEITEAWQEEGMDFITARIDSSAVDYVTDETGRVLEGSKTEPQRTVEYFTFMRKIGAPDWRLAAIQSQG